MYCVHLINNQQQENRHFNELLKEIYLAPNSNKIPAHDVTPTPGLDSYPKICGSVRPHLPRRSPLRVYYNLPSTAHHSTPTQATPLTPHRLDTGTIGPITSMPQFARTFGSFSSTVHGLVVSTILIPAALSSFFGGHLANSIGRPRAIAIGGFVFGVGGALEAASVRLAMLIVGRAIKGAGEGLFLSTIVV